MHAMMVSTRTRVESMRMSVLKVAPMIEMSLRLVMNNTCLSTVIIVHGQDHNDETVDETADISW